MIDQTSEQSTSSFPHIIIISYLPGNGLVLEQSSSREICHCAARRQGMVSGAKSDKQAWRDMGRMPALSNVFSQITPFIQREASKCFNGPQRPETLSNAFNGHTGLLNDDSVVLSLFVKMFCLLACLCCDKGHRKIAALVRYSSHSVNIVYVRLRSRRKSCQRSQYSSSVLRQ